MVGGGALAGDGGDVTHEGTARIRAAADGARSVFVSGRRMGRVGTTAFSRAGLAPNRMAHRAQSMAVQLEIAGRDTAGRGGLLRAVRDFRRAYRFREGP